MKLKLLRTKLRDTLTNGQLYIGDEIFCFTLEDKVRQPETEMAATDATVSKWKVAHETAIPRGIYPVTLENSPRFGPETPTINNVPGFDGIRMHSGNTPGDTDGCIILGFRLTDAGLIVPGTTHPAVTELKARLRAAKDAITIQVL